MGYGKIGRRGMNGAALYVSLTKSDSEFQVTFLYRKEPALPTLGLPLSYKSDKQYGCRIKSTISCAIVESLV